MLSPGASCLLHVCQIGELVYTLGVDGPRGREELLQAGAAVWARLREVLLVGGRLAAREIVEVRRAACVEAIAQVLEEGTTSRAKVLLELVDVLLPILDLLAQNL